jgi:hypothetical protein
VTPSPIVNLPKCFSDAPRPASPGSTKTDEPYTSSANIE